jgi:hypothetical protein
MQTLERTTLRASEVSGDRICVKNTLIHGLSSYHPKDDWIGFKNKVTNESNKPKEYSEILDLFLSYNNYVVPTLGFYLQFTVLR